MDLQTIALNVIMSLVATAGFSIAFNIPKRHIFFCSLLGVVSWIVYILLRPSVGEVAATFFGTCAIVLMSRILAVVRKCPVAVLLIPGIITLAPGSAIYYTAYYFVTNDTQSAGRYGFLTLKLALAIVLGIIVVTAIPLPHVKKLINRIKTEHNGTGDLR